MPLFFGLEEEFSLETGVFVFNLVAISGFEIAINSTQFDVFRRYIRTVEVPAFHALAFDAVSNEATVISSIGFMFPVTQSCLPSTCFVEVNGFVQAAPAPRFSRSATCAPSAGAYLGEHTAEVLAELQGQQSPTAAAA